MSVTYKIDLLGSQLERDYENSFFDRAVRYGRAEGVSVGPADPFGEISSDPRQQVITTVLAGEGYYHPADPTLPLKRFRVRKIGATVATFVMEYRRSPFSFFDPPFDEQIQGETVYETVQVYRVPFVYTSPETPEWNQNNYLPAGDIQGMYTDADLINLDRRPRPWYLKRPTQKIYIPFNTLAHPLGASAELLSTVNDDLFIISGRNFPQYTLRYDGAVFRQIQLSNTIYYTGVYTFSARQGGFFKQEAYVDNTLTWDAKDVLEHPPGAFGTDDFPT
jgi:hypothetical protein